MIEHYQLVSFSNKSEYAFQKRRNEAKKELDELFSQLVNSIEVQLSHSNDCVSHFSILSVCILQQLYLGGKKNFGLNMGHCQVGLSDYVNIWVCIVAWTSQFSSDWERVCIFCTGAELKYCTNFPFGVDINLQNLVCIEKKS